MLQYLFKTVSFDLLNTIIYSIYDLFEVEGNMLLTAFNQLDHFDEIDEMNLADSETSMDIYDSLLMDSDLPGDTFYDIHVIEIYNTTTNSLIELISIFIVLACIGKSAQFGFHI
jgi:NADH:ubiquinone oxidoreductase subunit 5 (subunit L)/multisubunit Na+/H+ antiporter MnhA subunit